MRAYMQERFDFFGLSASQRRALQREALRGTPQPNERELTRVVRGCWRGKERELQLFGVDYVRAHIDVCSAEFLPVLETLITTKSWWDTVDMLATRGVGPLAREHTRVRRRMATWIRSENVWLARTALLFQLNYRDAVDEASLFAFCRQRMGDEDFFIRKGMGWALREYSKTNPQAVRSFVARHEAELSGLTRREALKWLGRKAAKQKASAQFR